MPYEVVKLEYDDAPYLIVAKVPHTYTSGARIEDAVIMQGVKFFAWDGTYIEIAERAADRKTMQRLCDFLNREEAMSERRESSKGFRERYPAHEYDNLKCPECFAYGTLPCPCGGLLHYQVDEEYDEKTSECDVTYEHECDKCGRYFVSNDPLNDGLRKD